MSKLFSFLMLGMCLFLTQSGRASTLILKASKKVVLKSEIVPEEIAVIDALKYK